MEAAEVGGFEGTAGSGRGGMSSLPADVSIVICLVGSGSLWL